MTTTEDDDSDGGGGGGGVDGGGGRGAGCNGNGGGSKNGSVIRSSPTTLSTQHAQQHAQQRRPPPHDVTVVEVNGASWLASTIDLEKIFLENGQPPPLRGYTTDYMTSSNNTLARNSDSTLGGGTACTHYPLLQFAERYFNVHTVSSGTISKTVRRHKTGSSGGNNVSTRYFIYLFVCYSFIYPDHVRYSQLSIL